MNFSDNWMNEDTRLDVVPFRMHRLSRRIPDMLHQINFGEMMQRPEEVGMEPGQIKAQNQNSNTKVHTIIDKEFQFIRRFDTTTVSLHDSQIDLSQKGETVYRDTGYSGTTPFASMDKTMKRAVRWKTLSEKDKRRNKAISRMRSLVERPFSVIKRVFRARRLMVTTHLRVHAKNLFVCFSYNLFNLVTIQKKSGPAIALKK